MYKMELVYENTSLHDLRIMLSRTSITGYDPNIETYDTDTLISKLRACDRKIENSGYAYGNEHDWARLCALRGFNTKAASKDMMKKMLISGKDNTVYIPLMNIRINNPFNRTAPDIKLSYGILEYKYMDYDILREYITSSKHDYNGHAKFCRTINDHVDWLTKTDKTIIDSNYMDANEHDIRRLCYMRSIPLSSDIDKMRADLRSFDINHIKL